MTALRHVALIGNVAGQDDVPFLVQSNEILDAWVDCHPIDLGVQAYCGAREGVDIAGVHMSRATFGGRDGDESRARSEIENFFAGNAFGMIEDIARQGLPACPGESPERRRQADFAEFFLGFLP